MEDVLKNHAFLYGENPFTTLRTLEEPRILYEQEHCRRIEITYQEVFGLPIKEAREKTENIFNQLKKNLSENSSYRITLFREDSDLKYHILERECLPFLKEVQTIKVGKSKLRREERYFGPEIKLGAYAEVFHEISSNPNIDDVLIFNSSDHACEFSTSNLVLVKNGRITVPRLSNYFLHGTTLQSLLSSCEQSDNLVKYDDIQMEDIFSAELVLAINAVKGFRVVGKFHDQELGVSSSELEKMLNLFKKMSYE